MTHERRIILRAPSEADILLAPELAALFVVDSAIIAAQRILSIHLDPSSFDQGGARYPPTRALLAAMHVLRRHIRQHRSIEHAFDDPARRHGDHDHVDDAIDDSPF